MALASSHSQHTPLAGTLLAAIAFALLTSVDTIFKLMSAGHPAYELMLVNGIFATVPIVGWAYLSGGFSRLHTARPLLHFGRGSVSVASAFCAIYAYSRLPLANFYAIVFAGPLLVTALSAFWLGEKIELSRWIAIAIGFVGILVVINPFALSATHIPGVALGRIAAFLSVLCYSLSVVMIRRMRIRESNLAFAIWGYIAAVTIAGALALIGSMPPLRIADLGHLAFSGTLAGISSICLMTAYHRSPVTLVAPFQYTQIFWGALAGWLIWHQLPGQHLVIGAVIVALSGLFVIYKETRIKNNT